MIKTEVSVTSGEVLGSQDGAVVDGSVVRAQWDKLNQVSPKLRAIEIAEKLGVSEAQLVASRTAQWVKRLDRNKIADILRALPEVGEVMVLTRNRSVVHEKIGRFGNVTIQPGHAIVLNHEIDLRLFMNHWRHAYAVDQPLADGSIRHSLQFFDDAGRAVHKVFGRAETHRDPWQQLVQNSMHIDQSDTLEVIDLPTLPEDLADDQIDIVGLATHWRALRDTHDFFGMLRDFKVGRHQSMRLIGPEFAESLSIESIRTMLERAAGLQLPIMCFVGNPGCIQIHTGPVKRIVTSGNWLNVMDSAFNLHLRTDHIATAWIVRKPTADGIVTSIELFDDQARHFAQFFGARKPGQVEDPNWTALAEALLRLHMDAE